MIYSIIDSHLISHLRANYPNRYLISEAIFNETSDEGHPCGPIRRSNFIPQTRY